MRQRRILICVLIAISILGVTTICFSATKGKKKVSNMDKLLGLMVDQIVELRQDVDHLIIDVAVLKQRKWYDKPAYEYQDTKAVVPAVDTYGPNYPAGRTRAGHMAASLAAAPSWFKPEEADDIITLSFVIATTSNDTDLTVSVPPLPAFIVPVSNKAYIPISFRISKRTWESHQYGIFIRGNQSGNQMAILNEQVKVTGGEGRRRPSNH